MKTMLLMLMALFASCAVLTAQNAHQSDSGSSKSDDQNARKSAQKTEQNAAAMPELQDATPAANQAEASASPSLLKDAGSTSVEDAARQAAHKLSRANPDSTQAKSGSKSQAAEASKKDEAGVSEIGEFHPLPAGKDHDSAKPVIRKDQSAAKRIHGDVYGAGSNVGHASSEAVGATSKSGKTSVYVEGDQATSSATPPQ